MSFLGCHCTSVLLCSWGYRRVMSHLALIFRFFFKSRKCKNPLANKLHYSKTLPTTSHSSFWANVGFTSKRVSF
jgi:hypothetical protein